MTTTNLWTSFGASVVGRAHITARMPSQDAWSSFHHVWGDGIVVSDGLGSKSLSDYGSDAACRAVEMAARRFAVAAPDSERPNLLGDVLSQWLDVIAPLDPKEASATCLFALRLGDGLVRVAVLGDGCVGAINSDGSARAIMADKGAGFSNITTALTPRTDESQWVVQELPESLCEAVVLCTDGVSDDLEDVEGFMTGFVKAYRELAPITASRRARRLLEAWPVPKHSDDKTIACLLRPGFFDA